MESPVTQRNTGKNFEQHVLQMIQQIIAIIFGKKYLNVKYSYDVKIPGKAIKSYQIDILGEIKDELFIIECKDFRGIIDYKVLAAYIYKCIDISNQFPDKTIYSVMIDKSGFNVGATNVKFKPNDIWLAPKLNFDKQIKLLRISPRTFDNAIIVYEYEKEGINHHPLLLSDSNDQDEELILYLKNGGNLATRISKGIQLISNIESNNRKYNEKIIKELKILSYENISNAYLHIREYYDSIYFSDLIKHNLKNTKEIVPYYEAMLLSTVANYKRIEIKNYNHVKKPGLKWISQLYKLQKNAFNLNTVQKVSIKLFLGMWLARFDDYDLGIKLIQECKENSYLEDFHDGLWHYFVSLIRLGELHNDETIALKNLEEAKLLINSLCSKHREIGKEFLNKILNKRALDA